MRCARDGNLQHHRTTMSRENESLISNSNRSDGRDSEMRTSKCGRFVVVLSPFDELASFMTEPAGSCCRRLISRTHVGGECRVFNLFRPKCWCANVTHMQYTLSKTLSHVSPSGLQPCLEIMLTAEGRTRLPLTSVSFLFLCHSSL